MDDRFFTAWFPPEAIICGRRLTTFSTYHYMMLAATGSPFLTLRGRIEPKDLLAAVRVLEQRFGNPPDLAPGLRDFFWKRKLTRNAALFERQCRTLHEFMNAHSSMPEFWEVIEGGQSFRELTGPSPLIPVVTAMRKLGLTEEQAWNMSMGKLQWYCAEAAELDGSEKRFLREDDLAATEAALRESENELYSMTEEQARKHFASIFDKETLETALRNWREGKEKHHA